MVNVAPCRKDIIATLLTVSSTRESATCCKMHTVSCAYRTCKVMAWSST